MIKTKVKENSEGEISYPRLMEWDGMVVLFVAPYTGTVLHFINASQTDNYHYGESCSSFPMACFKDYNGTLEISNV